MSLTGTRIAIRDGNCSHRSVRRIHCGARTKFMPQLIASYRKQGEWRGAYRNDRLWGEVPVALKQTLTGEGPTITLNVADDFSANIPEQVELRVRLDQWVRGDMVTVSWDGIALDAPTIRYCTINDPHQISDVSGAAWLCFDVDPPPGAGSHEVKVVLERTPSEGCFRHRVDRCRISRSFLAQLPCEICIDAFEPKGRLSMTPANQYQSEKTAVEEIAESKLVIVCRTSCFHAADVICRFWTLL